MKGVLWMITPHQQLNKPNIFVQCFNGFHFFLSQWKIKYLEVMFDPLRVEALWDHYNSSLYVEAQGHLGTTFVVFFPNGYKHLIVQQRRTFQIHPRYISGGANWAIANNHDVMLTTVLQKFWLCEIWVAFDLVGYRFVFETRFIQKQLQLPAIEVGDSQGLNQSSIFASL